MLKRLNNGEDPNTVAASEIPRFNKAGGKVLSGLSNRRAAEVAVIPDPLERHCATTLLDYRQFWLHYFLHARERNSRVLWQETLLFCLAHSFWLEGWTSMDSWRDVLRMIYTMKSPS